MKRLLLLTALLLITASALAQEAPEATVKDADGATVTLPRQQDGVDVYLFWASWCPMCKAAMPTLQTINSDYGDEVNILALQVKDEEVPDAAGFIAELGYDFEVFPAADALMDSYQVEGTPTVYLVDSEGTMRLNLMETLFATMPEEFPEWDREQKLAWFVSNADTLLRDTLDEILAKS